MLTETIIVSNKLGLHARASAKLAQCAQRYQSHITIGLEKTDTHDCKSIMALMMLAAGMGTELWLTMEGEDEAAALQSIKQLFEDKFDEGE